MDIYPYIFDGINALCTQFADKKFVGKDGRVYNIISGKDDPVATHYSAIIPIEVWIQFSLNGSTEHWHEMVTDLREMVYNPPKKLLPFVNGYKILTHPVRVDLILEDDSKVSEVKKNQLKNIGVTSYIQAISISFYKPLFESLLVTNSQGSIGKDYIQIPLAFQEKIRNCRDTLLDTVKIGELDSLSAIEIRRIYLYLAQHDSRDKKHDPEYISIKDVNDFALSCFPELVRYKDKTGTYTLKPADYDALIEKLHTAIAFFKALARAGGMNGGQFVPASIINLGESGAAFDRKSNKLRIRVARPKSREQPVYDQPEWFPELYENAN
ncbi:hypothetical protein FACS1894164_14130 [Spirochaetia bacterium]|nr:hypothetical protein FACS1894164_14130 [Spirochaetia bacterium]